MNERRGNQEGEGSSIRALSNDVRRRVCTGQVVITLSGACKELIDNALDAGATMIEIRVRTFGFESFEVVDDGTGIHSNDFSLLCKPHATSKLRQVDDFRSLTTFGFRGEALNALCAVSSVVITTRHEDDSVATKLSFNHKGEIVSSEKCARSVGTSVLINNLFETLPVRRKELERTARKEFYKMLTAVQAFALSRTDVRFCVGSTTSGKRHQVLFTPGGTASIKEVIVSLFGVRSDKSALLDIVRADPDEMVCIASGLTSSKQCVFGDIQLSGYVSSCVHGNGRSCADRQFVFFNKRPVDYPKLCRIANDVYQQYNASQYCFLLLMVDVPPESVDVNLSPDKRLVCFEREKELFAVVRASLLATFAPVLGKTLSLSSVERKQRPSEADVSYEGAASMEESSSSDLDIGLVDYMPCVDDDRLPLVCTQSVLEGEKAAQPVGVLTEITLCPDKPVRPAAVRLCGSEGTRKRTLEERASDACKQSKRVSLKKLEEFSFKVIPHVKGSQSGDVDSVWPLDSPSNSTPLENPSRPSEGSRASDGQSSFGVASSDVIHSSVHSRAESSHSETNVEPCESRIEPSHSIASCSSAVGNPADSSNGVLRVQQRASFSMSSLTNRMEKLNSERCDGGERGATSVSSAVNRSAFTVVDAKTAENELSAHITKADFGDMKVVGQFNNGFIIARLRGDLFIVDQHASDEKFNFENFQKRARVQSQALLSPMPLEIGAMAESVLRDNMEIFNYSGFEFIVDSDGEPGRRVMLTAIPVLNNLQFSVADIEEMLSVISEYPGVLYRPKKLQKLFASRACRKSVMVGTALNSSTMQRIVTQLARLDNPWTCPHGRPTLRHLCSLSVAKEEGESVRAEENSQNASENCS